MKFKKNKMKYGYDHGTMCIGIPIGIDFYVNDCGDGTMYRLRGPGYGDNDNYGNGALYVWGLNAKQRKRFEREIKKEECR